MLEVVLGESKFSNGLTCLPCNSLVWDRSCVLFSCNNVLLLLLWLLFNMEEAVDGGIAGGGEVGRDAIAALLGSGTSWCCKRLPPVGFRRRDTWRRWEEDSSELLLLETSRTLLDRVIFTLPFSFWSSNEPLANLILSSIWISVEDSSCCCCCCLCNSSCCCCCNCCCCCLYWICSACSSLANSDPLANVGGPRQSMRGPSGAAVVVVVMVLFSTSALFLAVVVGFRGRPRVVPLLPNERLVPSCSTRRVDSLLGKLGAVGGTVGACFVWSSNFKSLVDLCRRTVLVLAVVGCWESSKVLSKEMWANGFATLLGWYWYWMLLYK